MESIYEQFIPTLANVAKGSKEIDKIYTIVLQLETEIAFLRAKL